MGVWGLYATPNGVVVLKTNMNELDKRILKGIEYFRREMHGEFTGTKKVHLLTLFSLIEDRINGKEVNMNVLSTEPRFKKNEELVIGEVFPESEGYTRTGGFNNDQVVSPNQTASRQDF